MILIGKAKCQEPAVHSGKHPGTAPLTPDPRALARMSYRERLALKHSDPETYARLRSDR